MNCASCGKANPAGARYCAHCGVEQSVPTPIAAVAAAAMTSRSRNTVLQAANAAQADPAVDLRPRSMPEGERAPLPGGAVPRAAPGLEAGAIAGSAQAPPAYASAPRRAGLAVALIVGCLVVAVIAFAGWRMLGGDSLSDSEAAKKSDDRSVMSAFPPEATPQKERWSAAGTSATQAGPAVADSTRTAAGEGVSGGAASHAAGSSATPTGIAPGATPPASAVPPVEIKPLPAKPAQKATRRPPVEKAPAPKSPPTPVASAPTPAASEPAPMRAPVVATAPKPAPVIDRWTRMSDELSRCTREDFISRVICDQRVRLRYCDGYWGKVTQCPGNPAPERGQ